MMNGTSSSEINSVHCNTVTHITVTIALTEDTLLSLFTVLLRHTLCRCRKLLSMLKRKKEDYDNLMTKLEKEVHVDACMYDYVHVKLIYIIIQIHCTCALYRVLLRLGHITINTCEL